jgi:hypothetical protein
VGRDTGISRPLQRGSCGFTSPLDEVVLGRRRSSSYCCFNLCVVTVHILIALNQRPVFPSQPAYYE